MQVSFQGSVDKDGAEVVSLIKLVHNKLTIQYYNIRKIFQIGVEIQSCVQLLQPENKQPLHKQPLQTKMLV